MSDRSNVSSTRSRDYVVDSARQIAVSHRRTVFLTAVQLVGTSPHHLNPAIALSRSGRTLRVVGPADPPGRFEPGSVLEASFTEGELRLVPRGRGLVRRAFWYLQALVAAWRAIREIDADEIFVYGAQITLVALLLLPFKRRGTRIVYHTQDYLDPARYPLRTWLEAQVSRRARRVIVNERNRGRILQSSYALVESPLVVPTGLFRDWPVPGPSEARRRWLLAQGPVLRPGGEEPVLLVHQGRLRPNRCGIELLIALAMLPERYRLVVTGMNHTELSAMTSEVNTLDPNRIVLPGRIEFQEMLEVTASCDVGVLLYPNDGVGNFYQAPGRLSENCRAGIPSIASRFPSFEEIASTYDFLSLCDPTDPVSIAQAIRRLGERSPNERKKSSETARRFALEVIAFDQNMDAALRVMENG